MKFARIAEGKPFHVNRLRRALGVELELANWGNLSEHKFKYLKYTLAHDWSVRPSQQEMVINPLVGDEFYFGMLELGEALYRAKATVNSTCALHVHVDGTTLSYWELRRLLRVYARLEPEIYQYLILPYRRGIPEVFHYCQMLTQQHTPCARCARFDSQYPGTRRALVPLQRTIQIMDRAGSTNELKQQLIQMLYGFDVQNYAAYEVYNPTGNHSSARKRAAQALQTRKGGRYEWARYVGLNLHAWMYRGTVEWRMKEATTDVNELIAWPLWCGHFVDAVSKMREKESREEPFTLLSFTDRYMPRWITDWVERYVSGQVVRSEMPIWHEDGEFSRENREEPIRYRGLDAEGIAPRPTSRVSSAGWGDAISPYVTFNTTNRDFPITQDNEDR